MVQYKCDICGYQTNNKTHYEDHINKKIPCNPNKLHKLIKNNIVHHCKTCDKNFSRHDSLVRHNNTYHAVINGNENKQINGNNTNSNNTTTIETQNNTNSNNTTIIETQNIINNPIIIQPIINIHSYEYNNINDLTLFEQYLCLTSKNSPYAALLNHLNLNPDKPQYHNMKITNLNKKYMDVNDGQKWIKEIITSAVFNIVDSKKITIELIYDRFRCFLSNKAIKFIPRSCYYGSRKNLFFYKQVAQHVKLHLYNNRKIDNKTNDDIPTDPNNEVFWALSKKFIWPEVEKYITKLDKLNIDLDEDLDKIKNNILNKCENKPKLKIFFKNLLKRIDYLIDKFHDPDESENESSSCDKSNSNDKFESSD